jgi:DNA-directed RNA polymerase specialized sigma24 family protein
MLNIDKKELTQKFKEKDWKYVFDAAYKITDFILIQSFKINNSEVRQDIAQECCENFYKKILQNKVQEDNNIFSFIWQNSKFRILEILRKERKRKDIVNFVSYDNLIEKMVGEEEVYGEEL